MGLKYLNVPLSLPHTTHGEWGQRIGYFTEYSRKASLGDLSICALSTWLDRDGFSEEEHLRRSQVYKHLRGWEQQEQKPRGGQQVRGTQRRPSRLELVPKGQSAGGGQAEARSQGAQGSMAQNLKVVLNATGSHKEV